MKDTDDRRLAFREALQRVEPEPPVQTPEAGRYIARLALEARLAEDRAVQARQELAAASARLMGARSRVVAS